jgi:serine/threonine protein kinase
LTDFGLSKEQVYISAESNTMQLKGTPEYLPPEILDNKGHDKSADWWTLGCLIYEMLTGSPPYVLNPNKRDDMYEEIRNCSAPIP